ncbi:MAG TPA: helix-turn-helix domain-containing protein [Myxococcota bacterium]|nr:helix-turn-helix domain-containing protein [Myxococcota bacterium]
MPILPAPTRERTRQRILAGAVEAVARHGLAKLDMGDVSESAGVSRGTLYRYFASRETLLSELTVHEALRFWKGCLDALAEADEAARVQVLFLQATRRVHEHAALRRILETDPALVLRAVREQFPRIRGQLETLLAPQLAAAPWVRDGVTGTTGLADWVARLMVSAFLVPADDPEALARGLDALLDPGAPRETPGEAGSGPR